MMSRAQAAWATAGVAIALLALGYQPEIRAAAGVWNSSTAYGHCWLVLPIAGWLLWERRAALSQAPRPAMWAALPAIPAVLAWVAADWLGLMEGRQLAFVGFVLLIVLAAIGPALWWALSAALLYLLFLVPFGAFLTPALQGFTARFIAAGLRVCDIPFQADAFRIIIPEGSFYVAEACAGLRFLIASVAFGVLYAVTIFQTPGRRAAFIVVSCVVPVLANGLRGLGIVLLGHALGGAQAGAADHLVYGWVFFSIVIVLLAAAGLPFRQERATPKACPAPDAAVPVPLTRTVLACSGVLLLGSIGPAADRLGAPAEAATAVTMPAIAAPAGCVAQPSRTTGTEMFQCGNQQVAVRRASLARGSDPVRILATARAAALQGLGTDIDTERWTAPAPWMLARGRDTGRIAAYSIRVDGIQGTGGLQDRLRMLQDRLSQGSSPAITAITLQPGGSNAETILKIFLEGVDPNR